MRIPGPADVVKIAGQGYEAVEKAIGLVPRLVTMVSEVEALLRRVQLMVSNIEKVQKAATAAVDGVTQIETRTRAVVERAGGLVEQTDTVVADAARLVHRVEPLLVRFEPVLEKLEPMLARIAETTSPNEVDAVVKLIDMLPNIVDKLDADILPVVDTLSTVAPDLRDVLDIVKELNELIGSVPGLGRVKKKIEDNQELQDDYRAEEEPATAPDRRVRPASSVDAATPASTVDSPTPASAAATPASAPTTVGAPAPEDATVGTQP